MSWYTATFMIAWTCGAIVLCFLGSWLQVSNFQHRIDKSALDAIIEIRQSLDVIRDQNQRSIDDRLQIHKDVNGIKKQSNR